MASKSETLRLLVLHSSADNTEEIIKALKGAGTPTRPQLIATVEDFKDLVKSQAWDLILTASNLQDGSYNDIVKTVRDSDKDIPIIVLLEQYDEDNIVEALEMGAADAIVILNGYRTQALIIGVPKVAPVGYAALDDVL